MTPILRLIKLQERIQQIKGLQGKARIKEVVSKRISLLEAKIVNLEQYLSDSSWEEDVSLFLFKEAETEASYVEEFLFNSTHSSFTDEANSRRLH